MLSEQTQSLRCHKANDIVAQRRAIAEAWRQCDHNSHVADIGINALFHIAALVAQMCCQQPMAFENLRTVLGARKKQKRWTLAVDISRRTCLGTRRPAKDFVCYGIAERQFMIAPGNRNDAANKRRI